MKSTQASKPAGAPAARTVRRVVRRISPEVFEAVVLPHIRRLDPVRIAAVRSVMVDGMRWIEAAAMPGVALSALSKAVARGWRAVDAMDADAPDASLTVQSRPGLPDGWVSLHIVAPASVVPGVQALIKDAGEAMQRDHVRKLAALKGA